MPRKRSQALNGASGAPHFTMVFQRICSRKSEGNRDDPMATTPPMTSLWPPMNFEQLSTTRSTPCSSGRTTYGLAKVLSQTAIRPCAWATVDSACRSATFIDGLAIVST